MSMMNNTDPGRITTLDRSRISNINTAEHCFVLTMNSRKPKNFDAIFYKDTAIITQLLLPNRSIVRVSIAPFTSVHHPASIMG